MQWMTLLFIFTQYTNIIYSLYIS